MTFKLRMCFSNDKQTGVSRSQNAVPNNVNSRPKITIRKSAPKIGSFLNRMNGPHSGCGCGK